MTLRGMTNGRMEICRMTKADRQNSTMPLSLTQNDNHKNDTQQNDTLLKQHVFVQHF